MYASGGGGGRPQGWLQRHCQAEQAGTTDTAASTRSFPALGFDPAEGDKGAVSTALISLGKAQLTLAEVAGRMSEALDVSDDWDGDTADDFHDYGDDLPKSFDTGAQAMKAASDALGTWGGQLSANQALADQYESTAKKLKQRLRDAADAMDEAAGALPRDTGNPHYAARYRTYLSTVDKWSELNGELQKVIADAQRLKARHLRQANAAADAIRGGPDDAFQPQNDGWFVQVLDGIGVVSGIVSTASAAVAAGSLLIPGVGEVVAPVAGTVAATASGINGLTGLAQRAAGSSNAPGVLDIALALAPGRTATSGVTGLAKGALKGGLKDAAKQGAKGAAEGFTSGGLGAAVKNIREIRTLAEQNPTLREALAAKGGKDLLKKGDDLTKAFGKEGVSDATKQAIGRVRASHEAFVNTVDTTVKSFDAAGVELTPAQKRELELLKLATNPGRAQLENATVNVTKETLKQHGVGN